MTWRSSTWGSEAAKLHIRTEDWHQHSQCFSSHHLPCLESSRVIGGKVVLCNQRTIRSQYVTVQKLISATNRAIHFLTWSGFVQELKLNTRGNAISNNVAWPDHLGNMKYLPDFHFQNFMNIENVCVFFPPENMLKLRGNFHTLVDWSGQSLTANSQLFSWLTAYLTINNINPTFLTSKPTLTTFERGSREERGMRTSPIYS